MLPDWGMNGVTLRAGDALDVLRTLPKRSVQCVVTSPPYWGLRDYRVAGQYGHESTVDAYVDRLCSVFRELVRVLRDSGTVWLNLGDCYGGSWGAYVAPGSMAPSAADPVRGRYGSHRPPQSRHRAKDLVGVPWQVALAVADDGWRIEDAIVWHKPNARPESVRDRLSRRYEMLFRLGLQRGNRASYRGGSVWTVPASRSRTGHVAAGSVEVARRCVALSTVPGDVVLDPFSGSGTTGVAALGLGCRYIGIDIDRANQIIAADRLVGGL